MQKQQAPGVVSCQTSLFRLGFYGKLPGQGDFVSRHLSTQFLTAWDAWLQAWLETSKQVLGDSWLTYYLSSPVRRFFLSENVVSENAWVGLGTSTK